MFVAGLVKKSGLLLISLLSLFASCQVYDVNERSEVKSVYQEDATSDLHESKERVEIVLGSSSNTGGGDIVLIEPKSSVSAKPVPAVGAAVSAKPVSAVEAVGSDSKIVTDLFTMNKRAPREAAIGEVYEVFIDLKATNNLSVLQVKDVIPEGTSYVKSVPAATRTGKELVWNFNSMARGESKVVTIWLKPLKEGVVGSCATVTAIPKCCVTTLIGRAKLTIAKSGPSQAILGTNVKYTMVVTNTGSALAKNVVVTDMIPDGFKHASGKRSVDYEVGNLKPGESKNYSIVLKSTKRGKLCNLAQAKSSNAKLVKDEACTLIVKPGLNVVKTGTKLQFVGKIAQYKILVSNTGDTVLKNIVTKDVIPEGTVLVNSDGGNVSGRAITWKISSLKPGAVKEYKVSLKSKTAGTLCNLVSVTDSTGLKSDSKACTVWKGHPALLLEVVDTNDPLLPGEETTYIVSITNQGTANDEKVGFSAHFPVGIKPIAIAGSTSGVIKGHEVKAQDFATLKPGQVIKWKIQAKAVKAGDSRIIIKMTSDLLKTPVTEEESTHVY
jgi:uncharacterized repeat protein (TIGR01451 family)